MTRTTPRWPRLALALLLALGALAALPPAPTGAATLTVTTGADDGAGSLRAALAAAAPGDTIAFAPGVTTVTLTSAGLLIDKNLTIQGVGVGGVRVERGLAVPFRIFTIAAGTTVAVSGLTIAKGILACGPDSGGGLYNAGTLSLTNAIVQDNQAYCSGGGGLSNAGTATLTNVTVSGNTAYASAGGGIRNRGVLTLTNSIVNSNATTYTEDRFHDGGGLHNSGTATLTNVTIAGNTASGGRGGGLFTSGVATLANSTLNSNGGASTGGGVFLESGTLTLTNTTLSGNTARIGGSGLATLAGTATLTNATVAGNQTTTFVPGYPRTGIADIAASTVLSNTIVAGNDPGNCDRSLGNGGRNLDDDGTCGFGNANGSLSGVNPLLAPLGSYDGPTQTMALLPGSPAINLATGAGCPAADQRGVARPQGEGCDSGAFESRGFTLAVAGGSGQTAFVNSPFAAPLVVGVASAFDEPVQGGAVTFAGPASGAGIQGSPRTATVAANGQASIAIVANGGVGGPYTVAATVVGAPAATFSLTNLIIPTALAAAPAEGPYGAMTTLQATLTVNGAPLGGQLVYFTRNGGPVGSATTDDSGVAQLRVYEPVVPVGVYPAGVGATFQGSATHAASSGTAALTITQVSQTIDFPQPPIKTYGDAPFVISATASSGLPVSFGTTTPAVCDVGAPTTPTSATVSILAAGECALTGDQAGDTTHAAAPQVARTVALARAGQAITFAQPPGKVVGDPPFPVTATASSGLPVAFAASGVCTVAGGTVTLTGAVGDCTIVARQAGDANHEPAPDVSRTVAVGKQSQTITFPPPPGRTFGDPPFVVSATASSGLPVSFTAGPVGVCGASGPVGATITLVGPGNCLIVAHQPGDATYLPAPDVSRTLGIAVALTVTHQGPGGVSLGSGSYPVGAPVSLVATPGPGAVFVGWAVDGVAKGWANPLAMTMDAPHSVVASFAAVPAFADVPPGHPAAAAIAALVGRGIAQGYAGDGFGSDDMLQRAQLAAFVARAMPGGGALAPPACLVANTWDCEDWGNPFIDRGGLDPNLWRNVGTLEHYGVAQGYGDGTFGPTDPVTYAQTLALIARVMVTKGYWLPQPGAGSPAGVPAAHAADVATFRHYAGGLPVPADWSAPATRGWCAMALWAALDSYWGVDRVP